MKSLAPRFLLAASIALALGSAHPLLAQAPAGGTVSATAPATPAPAKDAWIIPDMELSKPKLSEVADFLRQATGVSIVISAEVEDREVPYLNLQNVSARCVLQAICGEDTGLALRYQAEDGNNDLYHIVPRDATNIAPLQPAVTSQKDKVESVDFKGGTLFELQLFLHAKMGANIVLPLGSEGNKVPPLRLRGVSALAALRAALIGAGADAGVTRISDDHDGQVVSLLKVFPRMGQGDAKPVAGQVVRVFSLRVPASLENKAEELEGDRAIPKGKEEREALDRAMNNHHERMAIFMEETRNSVEAAVAAQRRIRGLGGNDMPDLAVHWGTMIVIVTGRQDDMNIVAEVMSAMGGAPVGEAPKK